MPELEKVFKNELYPKIISFFYRHPQTVDTPRNIAAWLNLNPQEVNRALEYLVKCGVLVAHTLGLTRAYALTQDKDLLKQLEKFIQ